MYILILADGWKMPINISQEAYEKVKKEAAAKKMRKMQRGGRSSSEESDTEGETDSEDDTSDEDEDDTQVGDANVLSECPEPNPQYNIMFSCVSKLQPYVDIVK